MGIIRDFPGDSGDRSLHAVSWDSGVPQLEDSGPAFFLEDTARREQRALPMLVSPRQRTTDENRSGWAAAADSPDDEDIDPGDEDDEDDFDDDDELANDDEADEEDEEEDEDDEDDEDEYEDDEDEEEDEDEDDTEG